jgi:predicted ATPase/DNA-binding SARP family transcriptional activator
MLAVRLLGQFDVRLDDAPVEIPLRSAQSLLAYLMLTAGLTHRREKLAGLFWPEAAEASARQSLRQALWQLRRAFGSREQEFLIADTQSLSFNAQAGYWLDAAILQQATTPATPTEELMQAVAVYTGELLPGFYDDWVALEREHLAAVFERQMQRLLERLEAERAWPALSDWAERWLAFGQVPEPAFRGLMVARAAQGDLAGAAAAYQRCRDDLARELGVEPSAQTQALYEQLRQGRPLAAAPAAAPGLEARYELQGEIGRGATDVLSRSERPRHNLPAALTSFIGRGKELADVSHLLGNTRLLTLTGVGGTGKTRLALQLAWSVVDDYPGGVWLVELAPLSDPTFVPQAIMEALRLPNDPHSDLAEALIRALRSAGRMLIVIDNCEHVLTGCAALCLKLLVHCPDLHILATSREVLNAPGEQSFPVPPLTVPTAQHSPSGQTLSASEPLASEAVRLFAARAQTTLPTFGITPETVPYVSQIARRLGGLPLAIELAAVRVKMLSPQQIASRLDDAFRLLTRGSAELPLRQRTLRATMDWSHDLLAEPEQVLFRRLAVFAGTFVLEAVESVCASAVRDAVAYAPQLYAWDVLDLLSDLADQSLIIAESAPVGDTRYRLLEPVRQYAAAKLSEAGETEVYRNRHLSYIAQLASQSESKLYGSEQLVWIDLITAELDNIRAALNWALATGQTEVAQSIGSDLWRFWHLRDYTREGFRWLEQALSTDSPTTASVRARALYRAGALAMPQGDFDTARKMLREALALCRSVGDQSGIAFSLSGLAMLHLSVDSNTKLARQLLEESVAVWQAMNNRWGVGFGLNLLGHVAGDEGDLQTERQLREKSLAIYRAIGDEWSVAWIVHSLAELARYDRDYERAKVLYRETVVLNKRLTASTFRQAIACAGLGYVALRQKELERAKTLFRDSLTLFVAHPEKLYNATEAIAGLAGVAAARGQTLHASRLLGAVTALVEARNVPLEVQDRNEFEHDLAVARQGLTKSVFEAAFAEGRAMTLSQAINDALSDLNEP